MSCRNVQLRRSGLSELPGGHVQYGCTCLVHLVRTWIVFEFCRRLRLHCVRRQHVCRCCRGNGLPELPLDRGAFHCHGSGWMRTYRAKLPSWEFCRSGWGHLYPLRCGFLSACSEGVGLPRLPKRNRSAQCRGHRLCSLPRGNLLSGSGAGPVPALPRRLQLKVRCHGLHHVSTGLVLSEIWRRPLQAVSPGEHRRQNGRHWLREVPARPRHDGHWRQQLH